MYLYFPSETTQLQSQRITDIFIYLRYDGGLQYSINEDKVDSFKEMKEDSWVGFDQGDQLIWKISSSPGKLEKIKIRNVNKKDKLKIGKGSWKDTWTQKPKKVSDSEYVGQPNATGATMDTPYAFAYDIDYWLTGINGKQTLDPGGWSPPPPPPPPGGDS